MNKRINTVLITGSKTLKGIIRFLKTKKDHLEKQIVLKAEKNYNPTLERLKGIPGID